MKRPATDDLIHQPLTKISSSGSDNMKFQVEIRHQLEFTTSVANLQSQQISTNVTVKTMANGSLSYESQDIKPAPHELFQEIKQEPDNEFADLDFGSLENFMANDDSELNTLFSDISDVFDRDLFDQVTFKQEPKSPQSNYQSYQQNSIPLNHQINQYAIPESCQMQKPMQPTQYRIYEQATQQQIPAAQTLKNMAQQHQENISMNYMRPMMPQQQMNAAQRLSYHMNPFPQEMYKQNLGIQHQLQTAPMMTAVNQQIAAYPDGDLRINKQYQTTQFLENHQSQPQQRSFNPNLNIRMNQTQSLNIQHPNTSCANIQMQGRQQFQFVDALRTRDNRGNFTAQQQQNMYFNFQPTTQSHIENDSFIPNQRMK